MPLLLLNVRRANPHFLRRVRTTLHCAMPLLYSEPLFHLGEEGRLIVDGKARDPSEYCLQQVGQSQKDLTIKINNFRQATMSSGSGVNLLFCEI
jgi:hypothetical protein